MKWFAVLKFKYYPGILFIPLIFSAFNGNSQTNILLNGGFEDVNTCTEYQSECGVEAWFYLKDVQARMLATENNKQILGENSFGIFYKWTGYQDFVPVIGTILPCSLIKGREYRFKGIISARLNPKLILSVGFCVGSTFFVPGRSFSKNLIPKVISNLRNITNTNLYEFEYSFLANGEERYLTFGTFIKEDSVNGKIKLTGTQTVSLVLDNFRLIPGEADEPLCTSFLENKERIYAYNFRHKEMDYSLFGKGELNIPNFVRDSSRPLIFKSNDRFLAPDTLRLNDVLFDFNESVLKQGAKQMLDSFFIHTEQSAIDSIRIEGHTDSIGKDTRNLALSKARSESVKEWLVKNNVLEENQISIHPYGKSKPISTNSTAAGRSLNRRVELIIFRKKEK